MMRAASAAGGRDLRSDGGREDAHRVRPQPRRPLAGARPRSTIVDKARFDHYTCRLLVMKKLFSVSDPLSPFPDPRTVHPSDAEQLLDEILATNDVAEIFVR